MAPPPSEVNFAQGGGEVIMMCSRRVFVCVGVGAGKGQCTVTSRSGLLGDALPYCTVKRGNALSRF